MGVLQAILVIVVLAVLGAGGYALMVVLCWRLRNPESGRVELSELPPEVMEALRPVVEEMRDEGLGVAALEHAQRATGDSAWGVVSCDSTRATWAVAQCTRTLFTNEQRINLSLYSRLKNGSVIVTTRDDPSAFVAPDSWRLTQRAFETVAAQWEAHRHALESYGGLKKLERMLSYEEFQEWHQHQGERELDVLWRKGLLVIGAQGAYRFAPAKLYRPVWQGMVEVARWAWAKAGPWACAAKARVIAGYQRAADGAMACLSQGRRVLHARRSRGAAAKDRQTDPPVEPIAADPVSAVAIPVPDDAPPPVLSSPAAEPATMVASQPSSALHAERASAGASAEVAAAVPGAGVLPVPVSLPPGPGGSAAPDGVAAPVPYVPAEFGMLMPAQPGHAAAPPVPKSRLELYREAKFRTTVPGLLGWSVQGMLQCAALAAILLVLMPLGLMDDTAWYLIAAVLVLHELGHGLLMAVFGFRHPSTFFLPVFGWLARRGKTCVSPRKAFWTQMAGPLPGLAAGWGILVWNHLEPGRPEWLLDGAFWAVLLNTLFLVPILPFDGGRIADLVFFNRHPKLRLACYLCGGLALGALWFVSPVLLAIPLAVLAQVPGAFRTRSLSRAVRQTLHTVEPEEKALLKTFKVIEQAGQQKLYKRLAWPATIDRLLHIVASQRLGFLGRACGVGLHLALLGLPLLALAGYGVTLRKAQAPVLEEASGRIAKLEKEVRWAGAPAASGNRRILEQIQSVDGATAPGWREPGRFLGNLTGGGAGAGVPAPAARAEVAALARQVDWSQAGSWIVEQEDEARKRRALITRTVSSLVESARAGSDGGDSGAAADDLSVAYWAVISCEPRRSFMEWRNWSRLESEVLAALEDLTAAQDLSEEKRAWFRKALARAPRPEGRKLALLLLRDLTARRVLAGDLQGWRERMGWPEPAGNRIWDPEPDTTRTEAAAEARALVEPPEGPSPGADRMPTHRIRSAQAIHLYVTPLLSGDHIPTCLRIADHWSQLDLAAPCDAGPDDDPRLMESWNRRLRPVLRVTSHREVVAAALRGGADEPHPPELAGAEKH